MTSLYDLLPAEWAGATFGDFRPCATYFPAMDCILYLREDLSYRADRLDEFVTVLWHPHEDRAIGVKLKGGRFLFERFCAILAPLGLDVDDSAFMPLMSALQVALTIKAGEVVTDQMEESRIATQRRHTEVYRQMADMVGDARIDVRELWVAQAS